MRKTVAAVFVVVSAGALGLLAAPRAGAHALLVKAEPGDGASLSSAPSSVTLAFSEAPDPSLSRIDVLDTSGATHQRGAARPVDGDTQRLRVGVESLAKGVYTVSWRVVSRVDGHLTAGAFAFGVGVSPSEIDAAAANAAATSAPDLSGAEVAGRVVLYVGLLLLVGGAWVFGFAFSASPAGSARFMHLALSIAVVGLVVFAVAQNQTAGAGLEQLLSTTLGRSLIARAVGLAICSSAIAFATLAPARSRIGWDVAGVGAATAIFVHASAGHAAAGGLVAIKVLEQFVHITAAGIWIGGLAAVLWGMRSVEPAERSRAVGRFSAVAGIALLVVAGSGTTRSVQEVGSWRGLVQTGYGRLVIGKAIGIAVLAGLGALNRYRNVRKAGDDPDALRRTSRVELSIAVVVLVLAGLLASLAPAKSSLAKPASSVTAEGSDFADEVTARLEITPGQAGVNVFSVELDVRDGARVRGVVLRVSPASGDVEPSRVSLERDGERWTARGSAIATPGRWRAMIVVDRGADSVEIPVAFHTACPEPSTENVNGLLLHTIRLGEQSVQAYVDPAAAGNNEVHFTLFDAEGAELPIVGEGRVLASGDRSADLDVRKLSPGHVVAGGRLAKGEWVFDFYGKTKGGAVNVCFEDVIK